MEGRQGERKAGRKKGRKAVRHTGRQTGRQAGKRAHLATRRQGECHDLVARPRQAQRDIQAASKDEVAQGQEGTCSEQAGDDRPARSRLQRRAAVLLRAAAEGCFAELVECAGGDDGLHDLPDERFLHAAQPLRDAQTGTGMMDWYFLLVALLLVNTVVHS